MARTLDFTDGFTTETEPSGDTFKTRGLRSYATEAAFVTAKGSAATGGDMFYDSTLHVVKYYDNNSWETLSNSVNTASVQTDVDNHIADTANPHSVTATQVGLGNVDNTSDVNKPVSIAQQTALDEKVDKSTLTTKGDIYAASGSATPVRVGVGTDGQALVADSSTASGLAYASVPIGNRYVTKTLAANVTSDGTIAGLTVSGLTIGKTYDVKGSVAIGLDVGTANSTVYLSVVHDGSILQYAGASIGESTDTVADYLYLTLSCMFTATATSLTFEGISAQTISPILGNGTREQTYIQVSERNDLTSVSDF